MRVAAVMVVRNERHYLGNCLKHLIDNGLDYYIVDNASDDGTDELLASAPYAQHLIGKETFPYEGVFNWRGLIEAREAASRRLDADWILFVSADEMMHSYRDGETLVDAIARISTEGADVINFNEFVMLPVEGDYVSDCAGFPPLQRYYFFEPRAPRLMRARRADASISHVGGSGHAFLGDYKLAKESMALRHYIVRSQEHAYHKYTDRKFPTDELAIGWHANRHGKLVQAFTFPPADALKALPSPSSRAFDRSAPLKKHYWEWVDAPVAAED